MRMKKGFNDTRYRAVCVGTGRVLWYTYTHAWGIICVCRPIHDMMDADARVRPRRHIVYVDGWTSYARVSATHARAALDEAFGRPSRRCW